MRTRSARRGQIELNRERSIVTDIESTPQATSKPQSLVRRRWPTLAGLGFAALIAFGLVSGVELAPVLAASAAVYLGAAALQRPAAAWPLFLATGVVITVARLFDGRVEPTWVILAGAVALLLYGLLRGAGRPGYGLPLQTAALLGFGVAAGRPPRPRRLGRPPPPHESGRRPLTRRVLPRAGHRSGGGDRGRDGAAVIEDRGPTAVDQRLLGTVVEQILAESRDRIQPYFVAPTVVCPRTGRCAVSPGRGRPRRRRCHRRRSR
jgi:hypothetical protein